jgi:Ser/Thr protein kinase RdoA (MazF antagonist)
MAEEERLSGGVRGVVRVGDTVRRPPTENDPFVRAVLELFEEADWLGAPHWLGTDDQGRSIVSFVEGQGAWSPGFHAGVVADAALVRVAQLTREMHDLTADTWLAGDSEVVCHNDLAPKNTVYQHRDGSWGPVAFIDWDLAAPGERIHDVAHVCWQFLDLGAGVSDLDDSGVAGRASERLRLVCDAYGLPAADRGRLVETILWWQDRCWRGIEAQAAAGDPAMIWFRDHGAVTEVQAAFAWTEAHRDELGASLT